MSKAANRRRKRIRRRQVQAVDEGRKIASRRKAKRARAKAKREIERTIINQDRDIVVLQTYPQRERQVAERLKALGVEVYTPVEERQITRKGKSVDLRRYITPRSLFSGLRKGEDPHSYTEVPGAGVQGVYGPLLANGRVVRVPARELQRFADRVRDQQIRDQADQGIRPGQRIHIKKGQWASFPGIVDSVTNRGVILAYVSIFGRENLVEVLPEELEEAA